MTFAIVMGNVSDHHYSLEYTCGWCGMLVASQHGADASRGDVQGPVGVLRICPNCGHPSFFSTLSNNWTPAPPYGEAVGHLPDDVGQLYSEARGCIGIGAYHAAVMVGRKILMHVAVSKGADENLKFIQYVDYLVDKNLVAPGTADWVDEIRQVSNDVNHEIAEISKEEAQAVVDFVAMLLKLVYEFPAKGAASVAARATREAGVTPTTTPATTPPPPPVVGS